MRKNLGFRAWVYFRQGWGTYFSIIFAAINTLVVTYYLAIERIPLLSSVFSSFIAYVIIISAIGIPTLIAVGYIHFKKTSAYHSEMDISVESNPYYYRLPPGFTREVVFPLYLLITNLLLKLSKNEKLTDEEFQEITRLQKELDILIKGGEVSKPKRTLDLGFETKNEDMDT